jgi:protein dispatched 1
LADAQFLTDSSTSPYLRYAALFLPLARSTALLPFFHSLPLGSSSAALTDNHTQVVAVEFGLKEALFNELMLRDVLYLAVGAAAVCLMMWWYTSSMFLTLMSLVAVVLSLGIAYFTYTIVFELDFFPFMNMLAAVIVVGIGADDVFVYIQVRFYFSSQEQYLFWWSGTSRALKSLYGKSWKEFRP